MCHNRPNCQPRQLAAGVRPRMSRKFDNRMLMVLTAHDIPARPTRAGDYEAVFLDSHDDVLVAHRLLQEADILVELNFMYGLPMFINRSRKIQ